MNREDRTAIDRHIARTSKRTHRLCNGGGNADACACPGDRRRNGNRIERREQRNKEDEQKELDGAGQRPMAVSLLLRRYWVHPLCPLQSLSGAVGVHYLRATTRLYENRLFFSTKNLHATPHTIGAIVQVSSPRRCVLHVTHFGGCAAISPPFPPALIFHRISIGVMD